VLKPCNRPGEIGSGKRLQIIGGFPNSDGVNGKLELFGDGNKDATSRSTIKLRHYQACNARTVTENFDLLQGVLTRRRVEHEYHVMWGRGVELFQYTRDFFQLFHQRLFILQPTRGIQ
jgi:hypothetical protein